MSAVSTSTADQRALRDALVSLLRRHFVAPTASPAPSPGRADIDLWEAICGDVGLGELAMCDRDDVADATSMLALCFEALGERLVQVPALTSLGMALPALKVTGATEAAPPWLDDLARGRLTATLAFPTACAVTTSDDGVIRVTGSAPLTVDGASADILLLVAAVPGHGSCLLEVSTDDAARVSRQLLSPFDTTREIADLTLHDAPVRILGRPGAGAEVEHMLATRTATFLAAEQLGGMAACLEMTVAHARTRFQFGRSLGSFQVIKHRLSDLHMAVELVRTAVGHAASLVDAEHTDADLWATVAHSVASETYVRVASESLQIHGGIGFTWEHPTHLFLKRAKSADILLSLPTDRRARIAELLAL